MPDEASQAPAETQDQPTTNETFHDVDLSPPSEGISQDWLQDREKQMQAAFTQKTQALAEERKSYEEIGFNAEIAQALRNPETRDAALVHWLEQQGFLDDEDEDEEYDEEDYVDRDPTESEIAELRARLDARDEAEVLENLEGHMTDLVKDSGLDISERQFKTLMREAIAAGPRPSTTEQVFKEWLEDAKAFEQSAIERYRKSKDAPSPPQSTGGSGKPEIPIHDAKARRKLMNELADRAYASG